MDMNQEEKYIQKRLWKAGFQSIPFYISRIFPVKKRKVVFCCIEGTTGYTCNPKYIAEEFIRRNKQEYMDNPYELVWLVNDISKEFPKEIKVVKNTLWNRAYHLSTAKVWIDNSRKQLEARKRKGQIYIQTWHAKLGFKPTCLDRGASFSKIAYLVSKHDSDMIDYVLSNSKWYDDTLPTGMIYEGETLRTGSPRCDILVKAKNDIKYKEEMKAKLVKKFLLESGSNNFGYLSQKFLLTNEKKDFADLGMRLDSSQYSDIHFLMYAPTFRGGSQGTNREIAAGQGFPDYKSLIKSLEKRFGGIWIILLRLHPQLVARNLDLEIADSLTNLKGKVVSASRVDDMYEILAGCDAFMTDYSSAAFDAAVMQIPVFLYADDYREYEGERGRLLWDLRKLPFLLAENNDELGKQIEVFDESKYQIDLKKLFQETGMLEDGKAAKRVVEFLVKKI